MRENRKKEIQTWQNLNKDDYDFFLKVKGQEYLTIELFTEDRHYKSEFTSEHLESTPFHSITIMFNSLKKCKVIPEKGVLIFGRQGEQIFSLELNSSPDQQLAELKFEMRKMKRENEQMNRKITFLSQKVPDLHSQIIEKEIKQISLQKIRLESELSFGYKNILKQLIDPEESLQRKMISLLCELDKVDKKILQIQRSASIKNILRADQKTSIQEIKNFERMIDKQTLDNSFCFSGNKITLMEPAFPSEQVLLDIIIPELFTFQALINSGTSITVGIVDKKQWRQGKSTFCSEHAICYQSSGQIWWGKNGTYQSKATKDKLMAGSQLVIQVNKSKGIVCFIVRDRQGSRFYEIQTDILSEDREFVPFFSMEEAGDSATWELISQEFLILEKNKNIAQSKEEIIQNRVQRQLNQLKENYSRLQRFFISKIDDLTKKFSISLKEAEEQIKILKLYLRGKEEASSLLKKQKADFKKETKTMEKLTFENLLDIDETPFADNFQVHNSTITLTHSAQKGAYPRQLLMDIVVQRVFIFAIRIIKCQYGWMVVGVVDRTKQKEAQHSHSSGSAICYSGLAERGRICYGEGGEYQQKETKDVLREGMVVKVQIEGDTVKFSLIHQGSTKVHSITSSILCDRNSEFVPFIEMFSLGDSVEFQMY